MVLNGGHPGSWGIKTKDYIRSYFFSVFLDLPRDSFEIFRSVFITDEGGGGQREVGPVLKVSDGKWIVTKVQRGEVRSLSGPL